MFYQHGSRLTSGQIAREPRRAVATPAFLTRLFPARRENHVASDVTHILNRVQDGDPKAAEELLPLVYEELRRLAARRMAGEAAGHTLQATALGHEAWVRLVQTPDQRWQSRAHFFRTAAECMRLILIDHARRKQQVRRGGGLERVALEGLDLAGASASAGATTGGDPGSGLG